MREMMSSALMVVLLLYCQGRLAQTGSQSGIFINVPNHGIVTLENIGTSATKALQCQTTVTDCCSNSDTNTGDWFTPNNDTIPETNSSSIYQAKGPGYVYLQRNIGGVEGIYRCEIGPDGNKDVYHIGLYSRGNGIPVISVPIEFKLLSAYNAAVPMFSLTCNSTDGPATTVVWTRDEDVVPTDSNHIYSQTLVNAQTAQYSNTLTMTGEWPGNYQCSVSNDRNAENPTNQTLTVEAANAPTDISAIQNGSTITVTWSPPIMGATPTGYIIYYQSSNDQGSVVIDDGIVQTWDIIGRNVDHVYTITIIALSNQLPSSETAAVTVIRPVAYIELDGRVLPNNSLVTLPEIGTTESTSLRCVTPRTDCCSEGSSGDGNSAIAKWINPRGEDGTQLNTFHYSWTGEGKPLGYVQLFRSSSNATLSRADEGIYSCTIPKPGSDLNIVAFYVGIYNDGYGQLSISDILFDPQVVQFTLTCTSLGGPATAINWTKNGEIIPNDSDHVYSQVIINLQTAKYSNTLTIRGRKKGNYQCYVSNNEGRAASPILEGKVPSAPVISNISNVKAVSVQLSWFIEKSSIPVLKLEVHYQRTLGNNQVGCKFNDSRTRDTNGNSTEYTLNELEEFSTYDIHVVALNYFGHSETSNTRSFTTAPAAPSGTPEGVKITGHNETSITVRWNEVSCQDRNSDITSYSVKYNSSDTAKSMNDITDRLITITSLKPGTRYSIQVAAVSKQRLTGPFSTPVSIETLGKKSFVPVYAVTVTVISVVVIAIITFVLYMCWRKKKRSSQTFGVTKVIPIKIISGEKDSKE